MKGVKTPNLVKQGFHNASMVNYGVKDNRSDRA